MMLKGRVQNKNKKKIYFKIVPNKLIIKQYMDYALNFLADKLYHDNLVKHLTIEYLQKSILRIVL